MSNAQSPAHHSIDYIEIYVTDMAVSQRFYRDAFGWIFTDYAPSYSGIQRGDGESGGLCVVEQVVTGGPLIVLYSHDLESSYESVKAAGATIVEPPFDFPGGRRFEFEDPSGNRLGVWTRD